MQRKKLDKKELLEISKVVDKYREIETSLTRVVEQLDLLGKEKDYLLEKLDNVRKEEEVFFERIEKKHGEGKLDLITMEYLTVK